MTTVEMARSVKSASKILAVTPAAAINEALLAAARGLREKAEYVLSENGQDVSDFTANPEHNRSLVDRLALDEKRVSGMAAGIEKVAALPSPVGAGEVIKRPNGLTIERRRVPLGAVGVIYEARPNVTSDVAALCLKSGNACLLRGGKEAYRSNAAIAGVIRGALEEAGLPAGAVCLVSDTSRESAREMMKLRGTLDLLIPRGGASLIKTVAEQSSVPVIETGVGNCHVYADKDCDIDMALNIIDNAKRSRPSVCNAAESLLVHSAVAGKLLPLVKERLADVQLRGCERTRKIIECAPAAEEDFYMEYNSLILAVKIVDSIEEAVEHTEKYSSGHSEAIITGNYNAALYFTERVTSAAVYVNASTRFTDGEEFGLGAEIGISTAKLHARGPMGLAALTTDKWVVFGSGQVRM